jgi:hypothetical protein
MDLVFSSSSLFKLRRPLTSFSNLSFLSAQLRSSDTKYCLISYVPGRANLEEFRITLGTFLELSDARIPNPVAIKGMQMETALFHIVLQHKS